MTDIKNQVDHIDDVLKISDKIFSSRLILGTGKYESWLQTKQAIDAAQCDMFTVAVRRVNITNQSEGMLQDHLSPKDYTYLPNTAGCFTSDDAIRTLRLAREHGGWNLVKLEVLGDERTLYPNVIETVKAAEKLVADGFEVMVYTSDDPIVAQELQDIGCVAIMPLVAPIGSGLGIQNRLNLEFILESVSLPIIVDAGVGVVSDAAIVMEMGCDGVLLNTAVASAQNPILMANAMRMAVIAGRQCYLAGKMTQKKYGNASSPKKGLIS